MKFNVERETCYEIISRTSLSASLASWRLPPSLGQSPLLRPLCSVRAEMSGSLPNEAMLTKTFVSLGTKISCMKVPCVSGEVEGTAGAW